MINISSLLPVDGACVYVSGKESNPLVNDCIIAEANNVGVFVDNHAKVSRSTDDHMSWSDDLVIRECLRTMISIVTN